MVGSIMTGIVAYAISKEDGSAPGAQRQPEASCCQKRDFQTQFSHESMARAL
jgi:hypothetical protein